MKHAWALGAAALLLGIVSNCGGEPFSSSGDGGAPDGGDDGAGANDSGGEGGSGGEDGISGSGGKGGSRTGGASSTGGKAASSGGASTAGGFVNRGGEGGELETGGSTSTGGVNATGGDGAEGGEDPGTGGVAGEAGADTGGGTNTGGTNTGGTNTGGTNTGGTNTGGISTGGTGGVIIPPSSCPPEPPDDADACLGDMLCTYGTHPVHYCRDQYQCLAGIWVATPADCDDPLPSCDPELSDGKPCTEDQQICLVSQGAYFICARTCISNCTDETVWHLIPPPAGTSCPAFIPNQGQPCANGGNSCSYGTCQSSTAANALCDGGHWGWPGVVCPGG